MEVIKAIQGRRSIRNYKDKAVSDKLIKQIIEAGRYAPSSHNSQSWRFVVVTDKKEIIKLSQVIKEWFERIIKLGTLVAIFRKGLKETLDSAKKRVSSDKDLFFYGAPCVVLICAKNKRFYLQDCSLAAQNMMLYAYSLGIGSCWIGFSDVVLNKRRKIRKELGVPKKHKVMATLIFGYPEKFPKPYPRKEGGIVNWVR